MKKLKPFKVNPELLELFYHTTTESIVTYSNLCFYSSLKKDTAKLSKVTRTTSKLIRSVVVDLQAHFEWMALQRFRAILGDPTYPLNEELTAQTSVRVTFGRLISLKMRMNHFFQSFLPSAV